MSDNLTAVLIVFLTVVAPILIVFHYRARRRAGEQPTPEDLAAYDQLSQIAARMEARIATLERILDAEAPGWRQPVNPGGQSRDRMG